MATFTGVNPQFGSIAQSQFTFPLPDEGEVFQIDAAGNYGVRKGGQVFEFNPRFANPNDNFGLNDPTPYRQAGFAPGDVGYTGSLKTYNRADLKTAFDPSSRSSMFAPANRSLFSGLVQTPAQDIFEAPNEAGTNRIRTSQIPSQIPQYTPIPGQPPSQITASLPGESPEQLVQRIQALQAGTPPTGPNLASSGVLGGGQAFTGFFKIPDNPTVYGILSGGQRVAFSKPEEFFAAGGAQDFSNVQTDPTFNPAGAISYSQFQQGQAAGTAGTISQQTSPSVITTDTLRKNRQTEIDRIKAELESGLQKTPLFKSVAEFDRLRKEQGVVKDEEELASIRNEALLGKQELRQFRATAGQGVSEGGRIGAVSEAERNLSFRMEGLAIREQAVLVRLNSKNAYISTVLQLGQQDYNQARQEYEFEYNKNLKAIDLYNKELDDQQKDAMTAFTTVANLLKGKGLTDLDPSLSSQLNSLALQAGLPSGVFQAIMTETTNEKIDNMKIVGNNVYAWTTDATTGIPRLKLVQTIQGEDRSQVIDIAQRYPDAGILTTDTIEQANQKVIKNSKIYQQQTRLAGGGGGGGGGAGIRGASDIYAQDVFNGKLKLSGVPIKIRSQVSAKVTELQEEQYDSQFEARVDYDQQLTQLAKEIKEGASLTATPSEIIRTLVNRYGRFISEQEIQATVHNILGVKR